MYGKPFSFLVGVVSVMTQPLARCVVASPGASFQRRVGALIVQPIGVAIKLRAATVENKARERRHLAQANRHIAELEFHIAGQRAVIKRLIAAGRRTELAESLLRHWKAAYVNSSGIATWS